MHQTKPQIIDKVQSKTKILGPFDVLSIRYQRMYIEKLCSLFTVVETTANHCTNTQLKNCWLKPSDCDQQYCVQMRRTEYSVFSTTPTVMLCETVLTVFTFAVDAAEINRLSFYDCFWIFLLFVPWCCFLNDSV